MLSSMQLYMFIMFIVTVVLVFLAEFGTDLRFKRAMALASIATVSAAIAALVRDPPKAGEWPTMTWELQGEPARKKQTRTAYVRTGDDEGPDEVNHVVEEKKSRIADGNSAAERLEGVFLASFKAPRDPGPSAGDKVRDCDRCPEMVLVPAGTSRIGADADEAAATRAERPQRTVKFWPGFMMSRAEVSVEQYNAFATATRRAPRRCEDAGQTDAGAAVTCVSYADAKAYAAWLTRITGKLYRLPSAAEWEYVARAEQAGPDKLATWPSAREELSRVAQMADASPHPWTFTGLGSGVAEITADCWHDDLSRLPANGEAFEPETGCALRVLKDGSERLLTQPQRLSSRRPIASSAADPRTGFRIVRGLK
ncbi:MAG: SUMF1/EgtB/PvdO family nonheme iron enzyme [Hyphomicrobium sp.]